MARQNKGPKVDRFRISLVDDMSHRQLWMLRFTRNGLIVTLASVVVVTFVLVFSLIAFTPVRTFIPGYPDAHTKRAAINNAIKIDSLERVISTWAVYSGNLKKVLAGEEPVDIDSLIRSMAKDDALEVSAGMHDKDSLLRENVHQSEQFGLAESQRRNMPIEGLHFFVPLKGVISQNYDKLRHPYIDITAPANSVVMSVLDGTVINAGWSDDSGYTIQIQHSDDVISIYKHNQKLLKKTGDKVTAGTPVALVGNTGSLTTGDHLHFELWYKGDAVDPTKYINF